MVVIIMAAIFNAMIYVVLTCNPLVSSDNWVFLDTFLRHVVEGRPDLGDFLVKRAGIDHAQPLNKLLMLLNYRFFDLDFKVEGLLAVGFAAIGVAIMGMMAFAGRSIAEQPASVYALFAAAAVVYLAINSSQVFSFSLITLMYSRMLLSMLAAWAAWHTLAKGGVGWLVAAMLAYGILGDDSAILGAVSLAAATIVLGWRMGARARIWRVVVTVLLVLVFCRWVYADFGEVRGSTQAMFNVPVTQRIDGLAGQWRDAWNWFVIPAVGGIAHTKHLRFYFADYWQAVQLVVAGAVLIGHVWFWCVTFRIRPSAAVFLAVFLMLLFYAYVAGLLVSRVFVLGGEYLDQPRYSGLYKLGIVAMLLLAIARLQDNGRRGLFGFAVAVCLIFVVQPLVAYSAYQEVPYIRAYQKAMAAEFGAVARTPRDPPAKCLPTMAICGMPTTERLRVLSLLERHHLNLFSPRFARFYPELVAASRLPASSSQDSASGE